MRTTSILNWPPSPFVRCLFCRLRHAKEEEEPSWKIRRAKQLTRAKAKQAAGSKAEHAADIGVDPDDPETAHWGELLEDAKREGAAGEGGRDGVAAPAGEKGAGGDGEESSAQKKKQKKSNKRKKTNQWNKKAVNLWVYVKGKSLCCDESIFVVAFLCGV